MPPFSGGSMYQNKKGFMLYKDNYEVIKTLSVEQKATLLDSIFRYNLGEEPVFMEPVALVVFQFLRQQFDRDNAKYTTVCERNSRNAKIRWDAVECGGMRSHPVGTRNADKDKDTDKDKETARIRSQFTPPTRDELFLYVKENGFAVEPSRFIDFYESKGWMVGKNKMKDWKAAVRNWARDKTVPMPTTANTLGEVLL
jgi:hypothetical protein